MLNNKIFQDLTKNSSATALCALALRSAPGPALQAAAHECLLTCFLAQCPYNELRGERQAKPETVAAARVVAVAIG